MRSAFDWRGVNDFYGSFDRFVDDGQFGYSLTGPRWKEMFYREGDVRFTSARFAFSSGSRNAWANTPEAYQPEPEFRDELANIGTTSTPISCR